MKLQTFFQFFLQEFEKILRILLSMPLNSSELSGKSFPMSPGVRAPRRVSHKAWTATSPSPYRRLSLNTRRITAHFYTLLFCNKKIPVRTNKYIIGFTPIRVSLKIFKDLDKVILVAFVLKVFSPSIFKLFVN